MKEIHKNVDLHAFAGQTRNQGDRYRYSKFTYRTKMSGETDVEIEPITEGFLIRVSAVEVEVGTPVTVTVETPEDRGDALVSIKRNTDIVDLVRVTFPSTVNEYGWRGATLTWTPERPSVYEISVDGGEYPIFVRAYRGGGRT